MFVHPDSPMVCTQFQMLLYDYLSCASKCEDGFESIDLSVQPKVDFDQTLGWCFSN